MEAIVHLFKHESNDIGKMGLLKVFMFLPT
jgi:hypothetical protein